MENDFTSVPLMGQIKQRLCHKWHECVPGEVFSFKSPNDFPNRTSAAPTSPPKTLLPWLRSWPAAQGAKFGDGGGDRGHCRTGCEGRMAECRFVFQGVFQTSGRFRKPVDSPWTHRVGLWPTRALTLFFFGPLIPLPMLSLLVALALRRIFARGPICSVTVCNTFDKSEIHSEG